MLEQLESKLDSGVDRSLSAIVGYVKVTLQAEQKKGDFKPEGDDAVVNIASPVSFQMASPFYYIFRFSTNY